MDFFSNIEALIFLGLVVVMFIVAYFIFTHKRYNNLKKTNDTPQINFLVEFLLITFMFWISILSLLAIFTINIDSLTIGIFSVGLIIGGILVNVTCRYYIHDGLIALGIITTLGVILVLLIQDNPFENSWAAFMLGMTGSLLILPLYGRVLITYSKKTTIVTTIVLIAVLFMFVSIQETLSPSTTEKMHDLYYIVFGILYTSGILYLFLDYKHRLTWFLWLIFEWVIKLRYKIIYEGVENLSDETGLLILSNHISWIDWIIVQLPIQRRIHYMIFKNMYHKWYLNPFIRLNDCIAISKHASKGGFSKAKKLLKNEHVIGMFPEGSISKKGELGRFYPGFQLLDGSGDAKIVPMYIDGLWGSIFSRSKKKFCSQKSGFRRVIRVRFGPLLPLDSKPIEVKQFIKKMYDESKKSR